MENFKKFINEFYPEVKENSYAWCFAVSIWNKRGDIDINISREFNKPSIAGEISRHNIK